MGGAVIVAERKKVRLQKGHSSKYVQPFFYALYQQHR
jgi:hypothetical protein